MRKKTKISKKKIIEKYDIFKKRSRSNLRGWNEEEKRKEEINQISKEEEQKEDKRSRERKTIRTKKRERVEK